MSKWAEIRNDYYDDIEKTVDIDAWEKEYDDNNDGTVIATVNYQTKEVTYLDEDAKTDDYAQEVIQDTLKSIENGDFENC